MRVNGESIITSGLELTWEMNRSSHHRWLDVDALGQSVCSTQALAVCISGVSSSFRPQSLDLLLALYSSF
eukprot:scaffold100814_cov33-Tisochrysis_lutea.AAC.2